MLKNDWSIALALYKQDGTPIGQLPVEVDWEPANQWVRHLALCRGAIVRQRGVAEVHPLWRRAGGPAIGGFRVTIETDGQPGEISCDFPATYFRSVALALSGPLVDAGHLASGETFRYLALAEPAPSNGPTAASAGFVVQEVTRAPVLRAASFDGLRAGTTVVGEAAADEVPALVPRRVLDEITSFTRRASPLETGGALVGHLNRDAAARTVFSVLTAQLPAEHTEASAVRLAFTADTWSAMRQALETRGRGEVLLGWWHSHPVREWCRQQKCPETTHEACALGHDCFSEHDRAVHRTVFPAAHSVALVANDVSDASVTLSVYGWSLGMLGPRSLYVT